MPNAFTLSTLYKQLRRGYVQLILVWFAGSLIGVTAATYVDDSIASLMRPRISSGVSIFRQLTSVILPFLLSAYAVSIARPRLLLLISFFKSLGFCFCGTLLHSAYGSAGWLMHALLQFMPICTMPLLCWYCLRHIEGNNVTAKRDLIICALIAAGIAIIDYFVVSPLLAELIDYSLERYAYSCWI